MGYELVPLKAEHVRAVFAKDPTSRELAPLLTDEHLLELEKSPFNRAVLFDGKAIAVGGVALYWPGRGEVWAMLDHKAGRHMLGIHRLVKQFLDTLRIRRVEATAEIGFEPGQRWLHLLGFELDAPILEGYTVDGQNVTLYSRVRRGL